jgi:hypothetical protein
MVPGWVPDPANPAEPPGPPENRGDQTVQHEHTDVPVAPAGRFRGARRALGAYGQGGDGAEMRRGLGYYIRTGYGGSGTATRRMGGTPATAARLFGALSNVATGRPAFPGSPPLQDLLRGRSAAEVMDAIVEAVRPIDGTQDAEAARAAIRDALSELLTQFPEADLLNLSPEQCRLAIERYTAFDVFRRFELDVGKAIRDKAPSASSALSRLKEVRNYIREVVAASFRQLREAGSVIAPGNVARVVTSSLRTTFDVFASYAE